MTLFCFQTFRLKYQNKQNKDLFFATIFLFFTTTFLFLATLFLFLATFFLFLALFFATFLLSSATRWILALFVFTRAFVTTTARLLAFLTFAFTSYAFAFACFATFSLSFHYIEGFYLGLKFRLFFIIIDFDKTIDFIIWKNRESHKNS